MIIAMFSIMHYLIIVTQQSGKTRANMIIIIIPISQISKLRLRELIRLA